MSETLKRSTAQRDVTITITLKVTDDVTELVADMANVLRRMTAEGTEEDFYGDAVLPVSDAYADRLSDDLAWVARAVGAQAAQLLAGASRVDSWDVHAEQDWPADFDVIVHELVEDEQA